MTVNPGPPPWSRSGQPAEPERTEDGLEIVRTRHGLFFRETEGGPLYPYLSAEEQWARIERLFAEPHGGQGRVRLDWDAWRA